MERGKGFKLVGLGCRAVWDLDFEASALVKETPIRFDRVLGIVLPGLVLVLEPVVRHLLRVRLTDERVHHRLQVGHARNRRWHYKKGT